MTHMGIIYGRAVGTCPYHFSDDLKLSLPVFNLCLDTDRVVVFCGFMTFSNICRLPNGQKRHPFEVVVYHHSLSALKENKLNTLMFP